ncbi:unnamed protein product [Mytilus coruscus]|uniref:G-protein coupled receptors family 1 profile domain-containing protein n=1 Tax=Mytilus coruscus TaxID=42192 RepID=A0A6J8C8X0_MYTCO|nr:unnamed protein product [Mytilus coruscus]
MHLQFYFKKLRSFTIKIIKTEHHISNLETYIDQGIIPKGLVLKASPLTTGEKSNRFFHRWNNILFNSSFSLMDLLRQEAIHQVNYLYKLRDNLHCRSREQLSDLELDEIQETGPDSLITDVNYNITALLTIIAGITVMVNFVCVIICFKALKQKFHHLTILALCLSDMALAVSSIINTLTILLKSSNAVFCLLQIFLLAFGIQLTYSLVLLLCLQRYFTVKSFNLGTMEKIDKKKFSYIGGTIIVVFIWSLTGTVLTPHETHISECKPFLIYGDNFLIFIITIFAPVTIIIVSLVLLSCITSIRIWKMFFAVRKIAPLADCNISINATTSYTNRQSTDVKQDLYDTYQLNSSKEYDEKEIPQQNSRRVVDLEEIDLQTSYLNNENMKNISVKRKIIERNEGNDHYVFSFNRNNFKLQNRNIQTAQIGNVNVNIDRKANQDLFVQVEGNQYDCKEIITSHYSRNHVEVEEDFDENIKEKTGISKSKANDCTNQASNTVLTESIQMTVLPNEFVPTATPNCNIPVDKNWSHKKSWELRAFISSIIIAAYTVALTGPFIASYWISVFSISLITFRYLWQVSQEDVIKQAQEFV